MANLQWNSMPAELQGKPEDVRNAVKALLGEAGDCSRRIPSCGGGIPPGVSMANLRAFIGAARE